MGIQDRFLIFKSIKGSTVSFEKLVKKHYRTLFRFALSMTKGNEELAGDVLQNALLKAFLNIKTFKQKSSFTSWLWVIIKNEFLRINKKESLEKTGISDDISQNFPDSELLSLEKNFVLEQRKENLYKMIEKLSENHREIIMMIEMSGMSYSEAGEYLGIPEGSVKSRLFRAREELFKIVEKNRELFL
ncbi:MAG: RNA polymerase sigma factor [bacterium]